MGLVVAQIQERETAMPNAMAYSVRLIDTEERERLFEHYERRLIHSRKSELYGCCIKLLTDDEKLRRTWEDNFYAASESIRSHGRLIALHDPESEDGVLYDAYTKTAFAFNLDYYGWIKSLALAIAGDILEDEHGIYSVHGACIDVSGRGIALIAPSKTGKTTHSWGLLRMPDARLITDDWFFVRLSDKRHLVFGSEKNCYVDGDIARIWPEYRPLVDRAKFDDDERAVLNVRWIIGNTGVIPMTSLRTVLLLKRDEGDETIVRDMSVDEAMDYLERNDFCNPHQLVRDERKAKLHRRFFRQLLSNVDVHLVNTRLPPERTQEEIRRVVLE
ncbi:MAG: hypothetical protein LUO79_01005 [Methanomassiliicoccales archaeon]|nr:hypothetical protein [Methanomassiliicoccales archaeon]